MALDKAILRKVCLEELVMRGFDCWRNNNHTTPGRKFIGRKGVPDIIGIAEDGKWVACEIKTLGDKFSQAQIDFLNSLAVRGAHAFIGVEVDGVPELRPWPSAL